MAGKMITSQKQVEQMVLADTQRGVQAIINIYCYVGEYCVGIARNGGTYKDQTGCLRASISYVVLNNGKVIKQGEFIQVNDGSDGIKKGEAFLQKLIKKSEHRKGVVFLMSAGMNYASAVEAKGFDVLTASELQAKELGKQMLTELGFKGSW